MSRATCIAGPKSFSNDIEIFRQHIVAKRRNTEDVLSDLRDMRSRIAAAKSPFGVWDAKLGPGRLQDIELFAQTGLILAGSPARDVISGLESSVATGLLNVAELEILSEAYFMMFRVQMATRLLTIGAVDVEKIGVKGRAVLLHAVGLDCISKAEIKLKMIYSSAGNIINSAVDDDGQKEGNSGR